MDTYGKLTGGQIGLSQGANTIEPQKERELDRLNSRVHCLFERLSKETERLALIRERVLGPSAGNLLQDGIAPLGGGAIGSIEEGLSECEHVIAALSNEVAKLADL